MVKLSTHILDSTTGTHAKNISVTFAQIKCKHFSNILWNKLIDTNGRLVIEFDLKSFDDTDYYLLSFGVGEYFRRKKNKLHVNTVSLDVRLPDTNGSYHLPIIISPHGASLWWSK